MPNKITNDSSSTLASNGSSNDQVVVPNAQGTLSPLSHHSYGVLIMHRIQWYSSNTSSRRHPQPRRPDLRRDKTFGLGRPTLEVISLLPKSGPVQSNQSSSSAIPLAGNPYPIMHTTLIALLDERRDDELLSTSARLVGWPSQTNQK